MPISRILGTASLALTLTLGAAPANAAEQVADGPLIQRAESAPGRAPYLGTDCAVYVTGTSPSNDALMLLGYSSESGEVTAPLGRLGVRPDQYTVRDWVTTDTTRVTRGWMKVGNQLYSVSSRLYLASGNSFPTRTLVSSSVGGWKDLTFSGGYLYSLDTRGRIVQWTVDSGGRLLRSTVRLTGQLTAKNLTYGTSGYTSNDGVQTGSFDTLYATTTDGALKRFHVRTSGDGANNAAVLKPSGWGGYTSIGVGDCAGRAVAILGHYETLGRARLFIDADWSARTDDIANKGIVADSWRATSYGG